jgi:succinate dehydrogenase/fumarate reductase-like Fe-S protein
MQHRQQHSFSFFFSCAHGRCPTGLMAIPVAGQQPPP